MRTQPASVNAVCPYFTMFPIEFPLKILSRETRSTANVLDPFCGRGTTNIAARLLGFSSVGVDSHPLAVALTKAKLISPRPASILETLDEILDENDDVEDVPYGEFWEFAFEKSTLSMISKIRRALIKDCRSQERTALRAIVLGALHGPVMKTVPSYFSNQSPRTFAPKPRYAVKFWRKRGLRPQKVDVRGLVLRRANRFYSEVLPDVDSHTLLGDSREPTTFHADGMEHPFDWVITSPPYFGLQTYRPDQWIRLWFLGGPDTVDYSQADQLTHGNPQDFASQLRRVWKNCANACNSGARMVIRFGNLPNRKVDAFDILRESLRGTDWRIQTKCDAGTASSGRRQADHFGVRSNSAREFDVWAIKC